MKTVAKITAAIMLVAPATATAKDYRVECADNPRSAADCRVDEDTYQGYRTYSSVCLHCHGGGGLGSTFAPNLLDRLNRDSSYERFENAVLNGVRGQMGVMKGFGDNPKVRDNVENLYSYLMARADGALPNGRPKQLEQTSGTGSQSTSGNAEVSQRGSPVVDYGKVVDHGKDELEFTLKRQIDGLALWITELEQKFRETPDTHPAVRHEFEDLKRLHASITGEYDELLTLADTQAQAHGEKIEDAILKFRRDYGSLYQKAAVSAF